MAYSSAGLIPLLQNEQKIVGLEIGICQGDGSSNILEKLPQLTLHGVDPYISYTDWNGIFIDSDIDYKMASEKLAKFNSRFVHHKLTSDDAVSKFADGFFDYIFVDGLHTYEQVLIDCKNYYSKLKTGGIFAGHDFNTIPAVAHAVTEFGNSVNRSPILIESDAWYWVK